jgi:phospholipid N-methyltransferase
MKVLVIGLRREQNDKLRKRFDDVEIVSLDDQALHHKPVKNADTFDKIISVTKFTNHTTHTNYKRHSGYTMVAGGFSSVSALIASLLS